MSQLNMAAAKMSALPELSKLLWEGPFLPNSRLLQAHLSTIQVAWGEWLEGLRIVEFYNSAYKKLLAELQENLKDAPGNDAAPSEPQKVEVPDDPPAGKTQRSLLEPPRFPVL